MENLGHTIRDERRKRKLTLERLSEKTNLSKSFLSQVERGPAQPSISSLKKIAQEFAIGVVDLFSLELKEKVRLDSPVAVRKNGQAYVEDVKVVRANRRKSLTLPGTRVSYDLLTPDLNRLNEAKAIFERGVQRANESILAGKFIKELAIVNLRIRKTKGGDY